MGGWKHSLSLSLLVSVNVIYALSENVGFYLTEPVEVYKSQLRVFFFLPCISP